MNSLTVVLKTYYQRRVLWGVGAYVVAMYAILIAMAWQHKVVIAVLGGLATAAVLGLLLGMVHAEMLHCASIYCLPRQARAQHRSAFLAGLASLVFAVLPVVLAAPRQGGLLAGQVGAAAVLLFGMLRLLLARPKAGALIGFLPLIGLLVFLPGLHEYAPVVVRAAWPGWLLLGLAAAAWQWRADARDMARHLVTTSFVGVLQGMNFRITEADRRRRLAEWLDRRSSGDHPGGLAGPLLRVLAGKRGPARVLWSGWLETFGAWRLWFFFWSTGLIAFLVVMYGYMGPGQTGILYAYPFIIGAAHPIPKYNPLLLPFGRRELCLRLVAAAAVLAALTALVIGALMAVGVHVVPRLPALTINDHRLVPYGLSTHSAWLAAAALPLGMAVQFLFRSLMARIMVTMVPMMAAGAMLGGAFGAAMPLGCRLTVIGAAWVLFLALAWRHCSRGRLV